MIVTNANTPSGARALLSADLAGPFGVTADAGPLAVSLPGGGGLEMTGTLASSNGKAITVAGYVSARKPSSSRPLTGADVVNGTLTVLNATKTYSFVLGGGVWTATLQP